MFGVCALLELLKVREVGRLDNFNSQFDGEGEDLVGEVLYRGRYWYCHFLIKTLATGSI